MESAVCVSGFLLLLFSTGIHLIPHPEHVFTHEGGDAFFDRGFSGVDDYVLYRVCGDGDLLLLINCSQPERPQPHGYEVRCDDYSDRYGFIMSNLTMFHSGDYRAEGWRGGNITGHTSFHLIVYAEWGDYSTQLVRYGGSVKLCSLNSTQGHRSSLQLYRYDRRLHRLILVLDTNSSLEPLVEDLKGRLQLDLKSSVLTLSGVTEHDSHFGCTVWRGAQCQSVSSRVLDIGPKRVFSHEEEKVTLSCIAKGQLPDLVYWTTFTEFGALTIYQTRPQEVMYMLNGRQTGDYSLIIPSVSRQHSGKYLCRGIDLLKKTDLYVCSKLSPLEMMFSHGQSVLLDITEHLNKFRVEGTQWYSQRVLQPQVLIVDLDYHYENTSVSLPEDLRGKVTVSTSPSNSSLIIYNLTAEDRGVYTWRVWGLDRSRRTCYEGSFRLVYLDPLGVHSPFYRAYAPLIGCGLLGLVAAVIWFKLRSRRGEQTSGRQSKEGQRRGDEDLHDDLEMAELNKTPSAVSDVAVEHSV